MSAGVYERSDRRVFLGLARIRQRRLYLLRRLRGYFVGRLEQGVTNCGIHPHLPPVRLLKGHDGVVFRLAKHPAEAGHGISACGC